MARIYEVIEQEGRFIPTVRSDDEGWGRVVCPHRHRSKKEAGRCLRRVTPAYMKQGGRRTG